MFVLNFGQLGAPGEDRPQTSTLKVSHQ